jgi:hypothetical protein
MAGKGAIMTETKLIRVYEEDYPRLESLMYELTGLDKAKRTIADTVQYLLGLHGRQDTPIYTTVYVLCEKGEPGWFPVIGKDWEEGHDSHEFMRKATMAEALSATTRYVVVEHKLAYPWAKWDYEDARIERPLAKLMTREGEGPARYCEAAIVATPKMALI